jgi:transposase InsO family protein
VQRRFAATAANEAWVADMTYVPTWAGFIYLAIVLDVWSRRVVGWSIGERMTGGLVLAALNMAIEQRKPDDVIHHSDQGSQLGCLDPSDARRQPADHDARPPSSRRQQRAATSCLPASTSRRLAASRGRARRLRRAILRPSRYT